MSANFLYHDQFGTIGNGTNCEAHTLVNSVDHLLPAMAFDGKFHEWNYSRIYLSADKANSTTANDLIKTQKDTSSRVSTS